MQTPTLIFQQPTLNRLAADYDLTSDAKWAERLGVSAVTWWRLRTGETQPSTTLIARMKLAFPDEPLDDLVEVLSE